MRDIRFRAWDKADGQMYYAIEDGIIFEDESSYEFRHFLTPRADDYHKWEIMQYTGLKDKNGKEIYEGDVVKCVYMDEDKGWYSKTPIEKGKVYFDTYWGVKFDCSDFTQRTAEFWKCADENDIRDIEIIGNIFENENYLQAEDSRAIAEIENPELSNE